MDSVTHRPPKQTECGTPAVQDMKFPAIVSRSLNVDFIMMA